MSWILRVALVFQCLGFVGLALKNNTPLENLAFLNWGWDEQNAKLLDRGAVFLSLALSFLALKKTSTTWIPLFIGLHVTALALASWWTGHSYFQDVALPAWAMRVVLPWGIFWLAYVERKKEQEHQGDLDPPNKLLWLLIVATSTTFIAHGVEAFRLQPSFFNLIMVAGHKILGIWIPQQTVATMLKAIGIVDILVALVLLSGKRIRLLALYMAFWGLITALSRTVQWGWGGWHHTALRMAHFAIPFCLFFLWHSQHKRSSHEQNTPSRQE